MVLPAAGVSLCAKLSCHADFTVCLQVVIKQVVEEELAMALKC